MSDHPTTFRGENDHADGVAWNDRASLHRRDQSDGLLTGATALRTASFGDLIAQLAAMPEGERRDYVIEKKGDREYSAAEAVALAERPDFPHRR